MYKNLLNAKVSSVYRPHDSFWVTGDPAYYVSIFGGASGFKKVYEGADFVIFENECAQQKLYGRLNAVNFTFVTTETSGNLVKNPSFEAGLAYWQSSPVNMVNTSSTDGNEVSFLYGQKDWFTRMLPRLCLLSKSSSTKFAFHR